MANVCVASSRLPHRLAGGEELDVVHRARTCSEGESVRAPRGAGAGRTHPTGPQAGLLELRPQQPRRPESGRAAPGESGRPGPATKAGKRPIGGARTGHECRRAASSSHQRHGLLARLWRWLRISLRRLQRKLERALATPQARRSLTALLARRLPGPLRVLVEGLGDPDQRGFLFWSLVVTLTVTLAIALLLSIVLAPVTGIVALVGVGVWMLIQKGRQPAAQPS